MWETATLRFDPGIRPQPVTRSARFILAARVQVGASSAERPARHLPHRPVPPPARCHQPYLYPAGFTRPDHVERPVYCRRDKRAWRPGFHLRIRHGLPASDRRLRHRALGFLRHGQVCSFQAGLALRSDRQSAGKVRDAVERVLTRFRDSKLVAHLRAFFRTLSD
jgi:hypothetical protein